MKLKVLCFGVLSATVSTGCLRYYNATPLSIVNLDRTLTTNDSLELRTKAFVTSAEIDDKFGQTVTIDSMVIPVQILVTNSGTTVYRILRSNIVLEATGQKIRLPAMNFSQMYEMGSRGYTVPMLAMLFGGPLGWPSLWTTIFANEKLHDDYERKIFPDIILAPGENARGVIFFDLRCRALSRYDTYQLIVELENMNTHVRKVVVQAWPRVAPPAP